MGVLLHGLQRLVRKVGRSVLRPAQGWREDRLLWQWALQELRELNVHERTLHGGL